MKIITNDYYLVKHPMMPKPIIVRLKSIVDNKNDPQEFITEMMREMNYKELTTGMSRVYDNYWCNKSQVVKHFGDIENFFTNYPEYWI